MSFSVLYFGSHPDEGNDDCWGGVDFDNETEARAAYAAPIADPYYKFCTKFIVLDGVGDWLIRRNPDYREPDRDEWRREIAREAGMLHGCNGYNEVMGY